jgi:ribonuclease PH
MARIDGRGEAQLRPVSMQLGFHTMADGSVLYRAGKTIVLCTASVDDKVPPFLEGKGKGWVTAEYQMHPRSNPVRRESRDGRGKAPSGRTQEIQRLVGRALRAVVDMQALGERQISIDCDVLEADGGTRTASITGGFVALAIAINKLTKSGALTSRVLREPVAAISVGLLKDHTLALDLNYPEDSKAEVDLNLVATASGAIVELQGTAEGAPVARATIDKLVDLALIGTTELARLQHAALAEHGVILADLLIAK